MGVKCKWKAPYLKEPWKHHNKALKFVAEGAWEVPPESLEWAVEDYWNQIKPALEAHIRKHPELCRPLTLDEAINGVPGSLYMKEFKMNTAAGLPGGTKEDSGLFVRLDPYPDGRKRYGLTPKAEEYLKIIDKHLEDGHYLGVWVRSCLKDEVVEEDSEKVRLFYIMECLFALRCRQMFLPICEFISRHPLTTECLVGVNCASKEWQQFKDFINEYATDGLGVDWDYSKYDLKRSADVMCSSGKLYIRMARFMGEVTREMKVFIEINTYTEGVLIKMGYSLEEIRNPVINWNGTVIWMYIWSSGNTLTVYGNSTENSLHQRISFHWNGTRLLGPEKFKELGTFRDNEHIGTYGDDGTSGSKPEVREICGFSAKKRYFDFINMKITNAKKDGEEDDAIPAEDIDFLKRKDVYHPKLGCCVGALNKDSIMKMGHMSSGMGEPEDLAVASMLSMLTEAFLHGEEYYEYIRSKLQDIARENHIWTDALYLSYDNRVEMWKLKYDD
jgi:hypothetical protein